MAVLNKVLTDTKTATTGALAKTCAPGFPWELLEVRFTTSGGALGAGNLTAVMDAGNGATYDCTLLSVDVSSLTYYHWLPTRPLLFSATDELDFAWANANNRTYGLEIVYRQIF